MTVRQIDCANEKPINRIGDTEYENYEEEEICQEFSENEFLIQSENYPFGYPNNLDQCFTIRPSNEDICYLELRFDEFNLESLTQGSCNNDYLEISGGSEETTGNGMRYCDVFYGIRVIEMTSVKKLTFHTNEAINNVGFSIVGKQLPCETTTTSTTSSSVPSSTVSLIPPSPRTSTTLTTANTTYSTTVTTTTTSITTTTKATTTITTKSTTTKSTTITTTTKATTMTTKSSTYLWTTTTQSTVTYHTSTEIVGRSTDTIWNLPSYNPTQFPRCGQQKMMILLICHLLYRVSQKDRCDQI